MCGILLFCGANAEARLAQSIKKIKHRGPDETKCYKHGSKSLGFNRLAINDKSSLGSQPYEYKNYVGAINGEIYNYMELIRKFNLDIKGKCDTHIILPLFDHMGVNIISELDGFYSGVIFDKENEKLFCIRDYIGKKPLFVGKSGSEIFITSELKAVSDIEHFEMLPKGASSIDVSTGAINLLAKHPLVKFDKNSSLKNLVEKAVVKRLPDVNEPVGVFLSGGLDSSIVTSVVSKRRKDAIYYTLAKKDSVDCFYVRELENYLGLSNVNYVDLPKEVELDELIHKVVYATESYNPSIISNGVCAYLLAQAAHNDGLKVILSGEGADELFCGYHIFQPHDNWRKIREKLIADMCFTELRRIDQCCMAHSIENRCPFLDRVLYSFASTLEYHDFYHTTKEGMENKFILRKYFASELPDSIVHRKKISFDVGSGIRALVVRHLTKNGKSEKQRLKEIWKTYFSYDIDEVYFHSYPVFNKAIAERGEGHR